MQNPFLTRQRPYPLKLLVDIHSHCNARCTMCPYPRYARQQSQGVMARSLYEAIIDEFGQLGRRFGFRPQLGYCYMGEPFLADDLAWYTVRAAQAGVQPYINTNASAMTPPKVDALLAGGFEGGIYISFHGATPAVYERITGLDYRQTRAHVQYLLDRYDAARVCIRGVDDGWPPGELQRWRDLWAPTGVRLEYLAPISRCGGVKRLARPRPRTGDRVRLYGCQMHHPLVEMVVLFDGRAVMCCQDMGREVIWGDVGAEGIAGVWNGPRRQQLVTTLYSGTAVGGEFLCARCEQALGPVGLVGAVAEAGWRKVTRRARGVLSGTG